MSDDNVYKDGDIVWVKLGNNWWPGEVTDVHRQPDGLLKQLKKKPYCVVKFFQEDAYEYIKSAKQIFPFQCNKKDEFIKKGTALYNAKNKFMEKFPSDVEIAERLTRKTVDSDMLIINDRPDSIVKAILGPTFARRSNDYYDNEYNNSCNNDYNNKRRSGDSVTKILNITPKRTTTITTTSNRTPDIGKSKASPHITTSYVTNNSIPISAETNFYRCNMCNFSSQRQNVMILHRRTHMCTGTPTTAQRPSTSNARKIPSATITSASESKSSITDMTWKLHSPATTSKFERNSLSEDDDQKYAATLDTTSSTFQIAKSTKREMLSPVNNRGVISNKHRPYPLAGSERASRSAAASTSREKSNTSLGIDADVKEITLPDGMPVLSIKGEQKLSIEDDTTDNSSSNTTEDLLRSCSPRKHKIESSEVVDNKSTALKSTAEEIRLRLLADWSDGEKEDDLVDSLKANDSGEWRSMTDTLQYKLNKLTTPETAVKSENTSFNVVTPVSAMINNIYAQTSNQTQHQNRIRNIPKKDRRDAVLKEFINDYNVELPPAVDNPENINCNSSNSSDSVVVVAVVPPNRCETIILDDNTGTDGETETMVDKDGLYRSEPMTNNKQFNDITMDKSFGTSVAQEAELPEEQLNTVSIIDMEASVSMACSDISANEEQLERLEERQYVEFHSEQQENAEALILVPSETTQGEFETTEKNVQSEASEENKNDLKSESENVKQPKQKVRGKAQKLNREQKNIKEVLKDSFENTTSNIQTAAETEAELEPISPEQLNVDEQPQTSTAAQPRADCFDFQEEEDETCSDALKSIADFKKKYLSPEKVPDKSQPEDCVLPEIERRLSTEQKDQQLAEDIEKLLEQTTTPNIADDVPGAVVSRTHSYGSSKEELPVKGLPIKERGKRIFKSRNRSRIEELPTKTAGSSEFVVAVQGIAATGSKMEENGSVAVIEKIQLETENQFIEVVESKANAEQRKQSAPIDGVDEYENTQQSMAYMAPALEMSFVKMNDFQIMEQDKENEESGGIVRFDSNEDTTILKFKKFKNGSLATSATAMELLHCANAERMKSEIRETNETNLSTTAPQIQDIDDLQYSQQTIEDAGPSNGCELKNSEPIVEYNVEEAESMPPLEKLEEELKISEDQNNVVKNFAALENIKEAFEIAANISEVDRTEEITRELEKPKEPFESNAMGEKEMLNEDQSNDLNELQSSYINNETDLIETHTSADKAQTEVTVIAQQPNNDDKELEHETEMPLAVVNMKNVAVEDQQHGVMLISEEVPQSRLTSPTDDNSSVCISEAGAEFGSPTSMLDDERLPILTGRLTPTDGLVDTIPTRNENVKILVEQEMNVKKAHENVNDVQNKESESIKEVPVPLDEGKAVAVNKMLEIADEITQEITPECEIIEYEHKIDVLKKCADRALNENLNLTASNIQQNNIETKVENKALSKEEKESNKETNEGNKQVASDFIDALISETNKNEESQLFECNDNLIDALRAESGDIENRTENFEEGTSEEPVYAEQNATESGACASEVAEDIVNNVIEEHNEANEHLQSKAEDNAVADAIVAEHQEFENDGKQVDDETMSANVLNNEIIDEAPAAIIEHTQPEEYDADDDFIESPPHEPLSGHEGEGDTEIMSVKTKRLNKTQTRRSNTNRAQTPQALLNTPVEVNVEQYTNITPNSVSNSPKSFTEFTKEANNKKRQTRASRQQPLKSSDYMKELDLTDLNEHNEKNNSTIRQNQRRQTKVATLAETENESTEEHEDVVETEVAAAAQLTVNNLNITITQQQNESPEPTSVVLPTETCVASQPDAGAQVMELPTEQTAVNITAAAKSGTSRKRRSATKSTPRRNAAAAQNFLMQETDLYNEEESIQQRTKSRKLDSPSNNRPSIETMQVAEEFKTTSVALNYKDENNSNYIKEVARSDEADECTDNEPVDSLIIEDDQCIIEEVYLNDAMTMQHVGIEASIENDAAKEVISSETNVNEFRPIDVPNAGEYVNYSSVDHQQQIEEVIVDTLRNMDKSPNVSSETLNTPLVTASNPHSSVDNTCINISPMEKVRINVDVANPLSTQIANILATKSVGGAAAATAVKQRKSNLEESIPSFIIERPGQGVGSYQQQQHTSTSGLEFIGEQDAVAHVQQMCPQVKITRKEKLIEVPQTAGVVQPEQIVATSGTMFDISNMPIVLGNEHFMSAQGDMQIVLTSAAETEPQLRSDGPQILQQQIITPAYRSTQQQVAKQRQRKRSTSQQQQSQQQQNSAVGGNKHGIIIIKAAPSDLIIQQTAALQAAQTQSQAIVGSATQQYSSSTTDTTTTYNLGSGVTLRPIAEPKQKQQQRQQQQQKQKQQQQQVSGNKSKFTASPSTGGRKQAGNTLTLPSSISVKHRQQKITDDSINMVLNEQPPPQQQTPSTNVSSGNKTQKRNHSTTNALRSQTQTQIVQQRRLSATSSNLVELQQQDQQHQATSDNCATLNRRLSHTDGHAPPPAKICRSTAASVSDFDGLSEQPTFAATAEQQLLQLQQQQQQQHTVQSPTTMTSQPPPLHPLHNRKQRHSSQHNRRISTKADVSTQMCVQEQQQHQRLQSTQLLLLEQQQQQQQILEQQHQDQHMTAVNIADLATSSPPAEIIPAEFEAIQMQEQVPEVYTEEILAEEFEANEHTPSVIAVPSQSVPGYPDTLLLCRKVGEEWVPIVAQPYYYTRCDQQLRPIPKEVLIGHPILTPNEDKTPEFHTAEVETEDVQTAATNEAYKGETGVTILIGSELVHMEWDQFLEVMRSTDDLFDLRDHLGRVFQLTRDALDTLQQDANLQEKYRQLQQLLEEQQLEEQQQLEQQELLQHQFIQQMPTVTVTGDEGLEADIIPLLQIDTSQTLQFIGTDDGSVLLQSALTQPPLSPPCTRPALTNATNALLNQTPIMSPLEKPSTAAATALLAENAAQHIDLSSATAPDHLVAGGFIAADSASDMQVCRPSLGDSLAVIGVVPTQPTLLPTTVTNPAIAPPKSDLIPNMTTAAQMHAQYRHAQRAIYNDPGS